MIKHRILGRTGLNVSELCIGTLNFGWTTDEAAAFDILDAFYAEGGNFIQAAAITPTFSLPSASTGFTEEIVGRWMTSRRIRREEMIIGTRVNLRPSRLTGVTLAKLTCERTQQSMRRLKTDYLDLLVFDWNETLLPLHQTLDAFDAAVRQCFVRYIGASNFPTWRVANAIALAFRRNQPRMELLQADYSLMTRARFEPEAMALCEEQMLGFIATSPLAGGFLTKRPRAVDPMRSIRGRLHRRFENAYGNLALSAVTAVAARHHASVAQVALAWVLHNRAVTSAMVGVRSAANVRELAAASELHLTREELHQLTRATAAEEVRISSGKRFIPMAAEAVMAN